MGFQWIPWRSSHVVVPALYEGPHKSRSHTLGVRHRSCLLSRREQAHHLFSVFRLPASYIYYVVHESQGWSRGYELQTTRIYVCRKTFGSLLGRSSRLWSCCEEVRLKEIFIEGLYASVKFSTWFYFGAHKDAMLQHLSRYGTFLIRLQEGSKAKAPLAVTAIMTNVS